MATTTKTIENNKTVFDLAVELYGSVSYAFKIIEDNPTLLPTLFTEVLVGMQIIYDDAVDFTEVPVIVQQEIPETTTKKYVTIKENQNIYDMSTQMYGGVEYVFTILADNPALENVNVANLAGFAMLYTPQTFALTEHFRLKGITLTTASKNGRSFDDSFSYSFN